jgi:AbrB family looped-hinge helix DNA binding protein
MSRRTSLTKETEILKIDSRGRIVIPRTMRKMLGLKENSQLMIISDSDAKEIKMIPLPFSEEKAFVKLKITIEDKAGSLGKIANIFGELGISLLYGETVVIKKGFDAEWLVLAPITEVPLEELTRQLLEKGSAKKVEVIEPRIVSTNPDEES